MTTRVSFRNADAISFLLCWQWLAVFFTISCSLGALAAAVILAKKCFKKRETTRKSKFQHLSQMQMHGILDDDDDSEDDSLVPKIVHSDHAHL